MQEIINRLVRDIKTKNSVVCVGIDPATEPIEQLLAFSKNIIDATADIAVIFKLQIAYYERFGSAGWQIAKDTIAYIHSKGMLAIDDCKRGDIGPTSEAYAKAHFEELNADFVTLNPYCGSDSIKPFLKYKNKGVFVLCRTSNPSAVELQDSIYMKTAQLINEWGCGAVVGANYPEEAQKLRSLMPKAFWLVPGYGAQGGTAQSVKNCFDERGFGAIISSSRGIIYNKNPRQAAIKMRDELNAVRNV